MLKELPLSSRLKEKAGYGDSGFQLEVSLEKADKRGGKKNKSLCPQVLSMTLTLQETPFSLCSPADETPSFSIPTPIQHTHAAPGLALLEEDVPRTGRQTDLSSAHIPKQD